MTEACIPLQAGPLRCIYDNGMLRSVRYGEVEIVRRVYMALRDQFWNTIPYTVNDVSLLHTAESFELSFAAYHHREDIEFCWQGNITGTADGAVSWSMRGTAGTAFLSNRIGWCLLHPIDCCKGTACSVEHTDGSVEHAFFPGDAVVPQLPFADIRSMTYPVVPGVRCILEFTGDIFDTEDQRNWTDASFKTYASLQGLPVPVQVESGAVFEQQIQLSVLGVTGSVPVTNRPGIATVSVEDLFEKAGPVPDTGLACMPHQLSDTGVVDRLRAVEPSHLRMDVDMANGFSAVSVNECIAAAQQIGCGVELAVHCTGAYAEELDRLAAEVGRADAVALRLLLYDSRAVVTPAEIADAAMARFRGMRLQGGIIAGTNRYFVEVNRARILGANCDGVCFSANPQVHTFDDRAVMENVAGLESCIRSAGLLYKNKKTVLSPLTMRPRKDPARPQKSGGADPRQMELFGAAWLAASIGACITAHLSSLTLFSTLAGSEGIMSNDGSVLYPVYQVLRTGITRAKRAAAVRLTCGESIVAVVAFATPAEYVLLVVNGTPLPDTIELQKVPTGTTVAHLDDTSVSSARKDPDFWEHGQRLFDVSADGTGTLRLPPYGLARLVVPGAGFAIFNE